VKRRETRPIPTTSFKNKKKLWKTAQAHSVKHRETLGACPCKIFYIISPVYLPFNPVIIALKPPFTNLIPPTRGRSSLPRGLLGKETERNDKEKCRELEGDQSPG